MSRLYEVRIKGKIVGTSRLSNPDEGMGVAEGTFNPNDYFWENQNSLRLGEAELNRWHYKAELFDQNGEKLNLFDCTINEEGELEGTPDQFWIMCIFNDREEYEDLLKSIIHSESPKILALWATPRSTSTAFEWMMRMRGDHACFHEPFGEWWYKGEGAKWPRLSADSPRVSRLTFDGILAVLRTAAGNNPTFSKDFPHYHFDHHGGWDLAFLSLFTHSFLIRDPAKVVTSMAKHWDDFLLEETGIPQQRALFELLAEETGKPPPLIDSDDLLEDPETIVRLWCEAVGIPFIKEALTWEPGERREVSWYDGGSWHDNLKASRGLTPQPRKDADLSQANDTVKRLYEACLPHYEHMYQYRLRP